MLFKTLICHKSKISTTFICFSDGIFKPYKWLWDYKKMSEKWGKLRFHKFLLPKKEDEQETITADVSFLRKRNKKSHYSKSSILKLKWKVFERNFCNLAIPWIIYNFSLSDFNLKTFGEVKSFWFNGKLFPSDTKVDIL